MVINKQAAITLTKAWETVLDLLPEADNCQPDELAEMRAATDTVDDALRIILAEWDKADIEDMRRENQHELDNGA